MAKIKESIITVKYPNILPNTSRDHHKNDYITQELFEKHILWLLEWRYNPISAIEFKDFLFNGTQIPAKSVLFMFENGYKNILDCALPILKRYRIPALIFLVVNCIGDFNRWENSKEPILSIDDIITLNNSSLVIFGSQSKTNIDLTKLNDEDLTDEIIKSKAILEEIIRYKVFFFNYPHNKYNANVLEKLDAAQIPMAFVNEIEKVTNLKDFLLIPSLKLSQLDGYWSLLTKLRMLEKFI